MADDPDAGKKTPIQVGRYTVRPCRCRREGCEAWLVDPPEGSAGFTRDQAVAAAVRLDQLDRGSDPVGEVLARVCEEYVGKGYVRGETLRRAREVLGRADPGFQSETDHGG